MLTEEMRNASERYFRDRTPVKPEDTLLRRISTAVAWGMSDTESTGMSQSSLCSLLSEAAARIGELERKLRADNRL